MNALEFQRRSARERFGIKGPRAAEWLAAHGVVPPTSANSWAAIASPAGAVPRRDGPLVARLGTGEFFLEDDADGRLLRGIAPRAETHPPGVYPVVREDAAFLLSGQRSLEVLAQVCSINFADLALDAQPIIMTMMIGVAVVLLPRVADAGLDCLIWCDPTFGAYLGESLGSVVLECGGHYRRLSS